MKILLFFLSIMLNAYWAVSQITPPSQPTDGPGGSNYLYSSIDSSRYGTNLTNIYWLFEPNDFAPPDSAPVIVMFHGMTYEPDSNKIPLMHLKLIHHIVKKGYTVVYPLYQYDGINQMLSPATYQWSVCANIINAAIAELQGGNHVKPKKDSNGKVMLGITGYSKGGGMSIDLAKYHNIYNLPKFDAVAAFVAGGSGTSYIGNIPANTKIIMVLGSDDSYPVAPKDTIIAVYNALTQIPCENKNFLELRSDDLGNPPLIADHHFYVANPQTPSSIDALDYFGSWKLCVAVFNCAFYGLDCDFAFGKGNKVTYMGSWSNNADVNPITILDTCSVTYLNETNSGNLFIKIYPNPFSFSSTIEVAPIVEIQKLIIYNLHGKTIRTIENISKNKVVIERNHLESGIYFFQLFYHNDKTISGKLMMDN